MNVAILGSGFGLYGYLPALAALQSRVLLPERYRTVVASRAELSGFAAGIDWVADEHAAIDCAQALVIARRPADQSSLIAEILRQNELKRLLLEKPLAPTPALAAQLQNQIEASGKILRMGYMFGFTDWGRDLVARGKDFDRRHPDQMEVPRPSLRIQFVELETGQCRGRRRLAVLRHPAHQPAGGSWIR